MPRDLTGKQAKFALGVAMGKSLADSYREAYEPSNPKAVSVYANARRTRKHPLVARRIAELQVKLMPGPENMRALYQHALAVGLQLTVVGEDDKVRLRAAQWIAREAEKREKLEAAARTPDRAGAPDDAGEIIAELRGLYAKALGAEPLPLVEPVEAAGAGQPAVDQLEAEVTEDVEPEPEAAGSTSAAQFRLERIPGRFGTGQYRRVRVQEP
jgi:hypothetical protein